MSAVLRTNLSPEEIEAQCFVRSLFAPPESITVSDWAEREVYLPTKVSSDAGPFSLAKCGYLREVLEDFDDSAATDITNCFGAQVFKSTSMMVGLMYRIDKKPVNMGWIMPNERLAQSFSETKWLLQLDASPSVSRHKPKNPDEFKKLEQQFDNCIFTFLGSGSKKNLKGRSMGIVVVDEPDDVEEEWAKRGESAMAMSDSRTKSYPGSKRFRNGTPSLPKAPVWLGFLAGDQRLRFVVCPECKGEPFIIEFDPKYIREWFPKVPAAKFVWDEEAKNEDGTWNFDKVEDSTRIECPHCKAHLNENQKMLMCREAKWVATNPNAPRGARSRRMPSWYSPHESTTIGKIAIKFLKYLEMPGGLRTFINEECALPWQPKATTISKSDIKEIVAHSPQYLLGQIPANNLAALILYVDVQVDSFWWIVRAWFGDKASALVDYGQTFSYDDLVARANMPYPIPDGRKATSLFCLIDSGFRAKREEGVYKFVLNQGKGRFFPTKGATETQGMTKSIMETDVEFNGTPLKLLRFSDPIFKYSLYVERIKERAKKNWWLPRNIGRDYETQLTGEILKEDKNNRGFTTYTWECVGPNHLGDCEKGQLIMPAFLEEGGGLAALAEKLKPAYGNAATG
jgi:phage terminase large subunit GpA-like protein